MFTDINAFAPSTPSPASAPPPGADDDWTIPQNWHAFTAEEHRV